MTRIYAVFGHILLLTFAFVGVLSAQDSQLQPLIIPPTKVAPKWWAHHGKNNYHWALPRTNNWLIRDRLYGTGNDSSDFTVHDLVSLECELRLYGGQFLHKGRLDEEQKAVGKKFGRYWFEEEIKIKKESIRNARRAWAHLRKAQIDAKPDVQQLEAELEALIKRGPQSTFDLVYFGQTGAVSPDGSYLYCYQTDRTEPKELWQSYWVFDLKTETKRPSTFNFRGRIDQPWRITPDGKYGLVRTGDLDLVLCDPMTGEIKKNFKYPWHIKDVYFSQDSKFLALIGGEAWVYEIETGKRMGTLFVDGTGKRNRGLFKTGFLVQTDTWPGQYAEFSPSGRYLFHRAYSTAQVIGAKAWTAELHSTHVIWDWKRDKLVECLPSEVLRRFEGWGPTDDLVLIAEPDHVALTHVPTGRVIAKLMQPPGFKTRLQPLSPDRPTYPRSLCRPSDGIVISEVLGADDGGRLIRWDLGPHMDEIRKRILALSVKP